MDWTSSFCWGRRNDILPLEDISYRELPEELVLPFPFYGQILPNQDKAEVCTCLDRCAVWCPIAKYRKKQQQMMVLLNILTWRECQVCARSPPPLLSFRLGLESPSSTRIAMKTLFHFRKSALTLDDVDHRLLWDEQSAKNFSSLEISSKILFQS